jgi:hypothetical protein
MENVGLIDWRMVGFSSLWIIGLAIELTVLGFADFHAKEGGGRRRDLLMSPAYQRWINLGLSLVCLGILGSAGSWWETALLGILAAAFGTFGVLAYRDSRGGR